MNHELIARNIKRIVCGLLNFGWQPTDGQWSEGTMPKDKHPPYFKFYVDDFISDSAVDAMTNRELGAYIRLLCKAWKEDEPGTVPDDDNILARWAKEGKGSWAKLRDGILRAFVSSGDGRLVQKRMNLEWDKMAKDSDKQSQNGSKGAAKRWRNDGEAIAKPIAKGMAKNSLSDIRSQISDSDSPDDDDDGARDITLRELSEIRAKIDRLSLHIDCKRPDNRNLVAKVAVLWNREQFSQDDIEQVIESYKRKDGINKPAAWLYSCLDNRMKEHGLNFEQMLALVTLPPELSAEAVQ